MAEFNPQAVVDARAAGIPDDQILSHIASLPQANKDQFSAALSSGLTPTQILDHLAPPKPEPGMAEDFLKSAGAGAARALLGAAGLPVDAYNAANKAIYGKDAGEPVQTGSSADLTQRYGPSYQPHGVAGQIGDFAGGVAPLMIGGGAGLGAKFLTRYALPKAASEAAGGATEGTQYEDAARLAASLVAGGVGIKKAENRAALSAQAKAAEASSSSSALREAGAAPDVVARAEALERANADAKASDKPYHQAIRDQINKQILQDPEKLSLFPAEAQDNLQGFVDNKPTGSTFADKFGNTQHWGLPELAFLTFGSHVPLIGGAAYGAYAGAKLAALGVSKLASRSSAKALAAIKTKLAQEPGVPIERPGPTGPSVAQPVSPWAAAPAAAPAAPQVGPAAATPGYGFINALGGRRSFTTQGAPYGPPPPAAAPGTTVPTAPPPVRGMLALPPPQAMPALPGPGIRGLLPPPAPSATIAMPPSVIRGGQAPAPLALPSPASNAIPAFLPNRAAPPTPVQAAPVLAKIAKANGKVTTTPKPVPAAAPAADIMGDMPEFLQRSRTGTSAPPAPAPAPNVPAQEQPTRGPFAREVAAHHMPAYDLGYANKPLPKGTNQAEQAAHDRGLQDRMNADRAARGITTAPLAQSEPAAAPNWLQTVMAQAEKPAPASAKVNDATSAALKAIENALYADKPALEAGTPAAPTNGYTPLAKSSMPFYGRTDHAAVAQEKAAAWKASALANVEAGKGGFVPDQARLDTYVKTATEGRERLDNLVSPLIDKATPRDAGVLSQMLEQFQHQKAPADRLAAREHYLAKVQNVPLRNEARLRLNNAAVTGPKRPHTKKKA